MTTTTAERTCATCTRTYDPDARTSHQWITRLDGAGLMCRVCQNRERRGVPTEREAVVDYGCPNWCQRTDHHADEIGPGCPPVHYGPDFGHCGTQSDGIVSSVGIYLNGDDAHSSDPAQLRQAAAQMVEAAAWLEAHQ